MRYEELRVSIHLPAHRRSSGIKHTPQPSLLPMPNRQRYIRHHVRDLFSVAISLSLICGFSPDSAPPANSPTKRRRSTRISPPRSVSTSEALCLRTEPLCKCKSYFLCAMFLILTNYSCFRYDCNGTPAQNWLFTRGSTKVQLAGTNFCLDAGSSKCLASNNPTNHLHFSVLSRPCQWDRPEDLAMLRQSPSPTVVLYR
jgi:hypothetical protein